jgi:hypothetical protein
VQFQLDDETPMVRARQRDEVRESTWKSRLTKTWSIWVRSSRPFSTGHDHVRGLPARLALSFSFPGPGTGELACSGVAHSRLSPNGARAE